MVSFFDSPLHPPPPPGGAFKAPGRLLVTQVDAVAERSPTRRFGLIPNGTEVENGFREVTFQDLSRAVDAMAWWIVEALGMPTTKEETIAYLGNNDVRYIVFILACHKLGYTIFLPSTRLSDEAYDHVFRETACTHLLFSQEKSQIASRIKALSGKMRTHEVPSVTDTFGHRSGTKRFDFARTYDEMVNKIAFMIHSSGTTGMPKPVPLTHGFLGTMDYGPSMPRPAGRSSSFFNDLASDDPSPTDLVLSSTPYFHLMGLVSFFESIFHNIPFVASPEKLLSVGFLIDLIRHTKPTATILPPSILEDMSHSEEGLACLGSMKFVCYGGAPLAPEVGDRLSRYTELRSPIGSSEMGIISSMVPEGEGNWGYFEWTPAYHVDMQPIGDGLYELVLPRVEHSLVIHGIFHTFPQLKEYRSKDLYTRHPSNPRLWRYHGRLDDVIVLSNGEKLSPVSLEKIVEGHPSVHRALLVGQRRFQTCLLIEPVIDDPTSDATDERTEEEFVESIWPVVQAANETVPQYGQVVKTMIRLSSREKPFKLTAKGTTQRHAVNQDYAGEIEEIYAAQDRRMSVALPSALTREGVSAYLQGIISTLTGKSDIRPSDDLYGLGLDSLQAIQLSKTLKSSVSAYSSQCPVERLQVQNIYAHPTVDALTDLLLGVLDQSAVQTAPVTRAERIAQLISKYTGDLHAPPAGAQVAPPPARSTVILTGSTGSLGTYILEELLRNPRVAKVYCFNRSADAASRQRAGFEEKGLSTWLLDDPGQVEFWQVEFGARQFGLPDERYGELLGRVDLIIHNAWKVNFNHPVSSFEDPHLRGVRGFVDLSTRSRHRAHLAFVSSVSTIGAWQPTDAGVTAVPEEPMASVATALAQGYGESKFVGERICVEAWARAGVASSILRVGQIAGPDSPRGVWNPHEWIPALVKSSKASGKVPSDLGGYPVDWVSVDSLARIITELLLNPRCNRSTYPAVFHLVNPSRTSWASLVPAIQARYPVQPVPLTEWLADLQAIPDPSDQEVEAKPALKLLGFFRALADNDAAVLSADISVDRAKEGSPTMAALGPVSCAQMSNWLAQWDF